MRLFATLIATAALFVASSAGAVGLVLVGASQSGRADLLAPGNVTIELRLTSDPGETLFGLGLSARGYDGLSFVSGRGIRRYLNDGAGTFLSNIAGTSSGGAPATQQRVLAQSAIGANGNRVQIALSASIDEIFPDAATADPGLEGGTTPMFRLVFNAPAPGTYTIDFDGLYQGDGVVRAGGVVEPIAGVRYTINVVPEPGTALLMGLGLMGLAAAGRRN